MVVIPALVVGLGGLAAWKVWKKKHRMTPERKKVYEAALKSLKDPVKLRELATAFDKENLKEEAELLRKRAALRELPADVKAGRRDAFKKGMASKDPTGIETLAKEFEKEGATGAAAALREYAAGLPKNVK
jgi:predicted negative regulator of RcsB-dependent stress response